MNAGIYVRNSTVNQRDEATIESQLSEIKERVKQDNNLLIDGCIYQDEGYSGELIIRPALDKLRDDAKKGLFEVLYVYDRGRLSRKFAYQELIIDELNDLGIRFITLHDVKAETPEEKVLQAMQGVFHEYERIKITERFRRGKLYKVRNGNLLGYCPPYGYDYIPKTKEQEGSFIINPVEAKVVKLIFQWMGEEGISSNEIIRRLNNLGIGPKKQRRATWTKGPIVRLLRNSTYYGMHYYYKSESIVTKNHTNNNYKRVKKTGRRERLREEWIPIKVPAIITKELFDKAQSQLKQNSQLCRRNNTKNDYLLRGLTYCSCGCRRAGESNKSDYSYYRCTDRLRKFPLSRVCFENSINSKVADVFVWNKLVELLTEPKLIAKQAERWLKNKKSQSGINLSNKDIGEEKQKLQNEEERYTKAYGEGLMSIETFKSVMADLKQRKILTVKEESETKKSNFNYNLSPQWLANEATKTIKKLDFSNKRAIVCKLIDRVIANANEIQIFGYIPVNKLSYVVLSPNNYDRRSA